MNIKDMNLKKQQKGFTIIEVLIVLAIAGLIILIVFLAVPALQRNSRNTQRKNDAGRASGLISEFVSNNNGKLPTAIGPATTPGNIQLGTNYTQLDPPTSLSTGATAFPTTDDKFFLVTKQKCENNVLSSSTRGYAITYLVETSSGTIKQCV